MRAETVWLLEGKTGEKYIDEANEQANSARNSSRVMIGPVVRGVHDTQSLLYTSHIASLAGYRVYPSEDRSRVGSPGGAVGALSLRVPGAPMQLFDLVVRGGTVVTAEGRTAADVAISDGQIVQVGPHLGAGRQEVDASGRLVLPGAIDSHCHIAQESSTGLMTADDFLTATR